VQRSEHQAYFQERGQNRTSTLTTDIINSNTLQDNGAHGAGRNNGSLGKEQTNR